MYWYIWWEFTQDFIKTHSYFVVLIFSIGLTIYKRARKHCKETTYQFTVKCYVDWTADKGYQYATITVIIKDDGKWVMAWENELKDDDSNFIVQNLP